MIPVCIFAKPPVPGLVKTRLAPSLGADAAAELAAVMLRDVWSTVCSCSGARAVLAAAGPGEFPIRVDSQDLWMQSAGDLGHRIEQILRHGLQQAPAAIALGADSPLLTPAILAEALAALTTHDAVLGRCEDGGFYLLGLRDCPVGLLAGIPWSSPLTAAAVADRIRARGGRIAELESLLDVDLPGDVEQLMRVLELHPELAPRTHAFLMLRRAWQPC